MRKQKKQYTKPFKRWDKKRIIEERKLLKLYGLKNKKELWKAQTVLRKFRAVARRLLPLRGEEKEKRERELLSKLYRLGLLDEKATLDDVLSLSVTDLLERRLQTMVWRLGLARTVKQARQLIVHGHVYVNGRRVRVPSYWVKRGEERNITLDREMEEYIKSAPEVSS